MLWASENPYLLAIPIEFAAQIREHGQVTPGLFCLNRLNEICLALKIKTPTALLRQGQDKDEQRAATLNSFYDQVNIALTRGISFGHAHHADLSVIDP